MPTVLVMLGSTVLAAVHPMFHGIRCWAQFYLAFDVFLFYQVK